MRLSNHESHCHSSVLRCILISLFLTNVASSEDVQIITFNSRRCIKKGKIESSYFWKFIGKSNIDIKVPGDAEISDEKFAKIEEKLIDHLLALRLRALEKEKADAPRSDSEISKSDIESIVFRYYNYGVQLCPVKIIGEVFVHINAGIIRQSDDHEFDGELIAANGGGNNFWNILYDVKNDSFGKLKINDPF